MKTQIGSPPAPDFDHPLEMLTACHDRMQDQIQTLGGMMVHIAAHGCDEQARQAAVNVTRYFDTAGEHHHEDEEIDLFPLLEARAEEARALTQRLRTDHTKMRALWRMLRVQLHAIAQGTSEQLDAAQVAEFDRVYRDHIALEESELLPLAGRVLDPGAAETLGALMARRRGVRQP